VRLSDFWRRMDEALGPMAETYARDQVLSELGGRTVTEALDAGEAAKDVWRAVVSAAQLPSRFR
jgi:hypothetical protein